MYIYVATSWKNKRQALMVKELRTDGHEVYDFKNPVPGVEGGGFSWGSIDPEWKDWTTEQYAKALQHPIAKAAYKLDIDALNKCDLCVLMLPSGRSASWELGSAMGQGKSAIVYFDPRAMPRKMTDEDGNWILHPNLDPELMYSGASITDSIHTVRECARAVATRLTSPSHAAVADR